MNWRSFGVSIIIYLIIMFPENVSSIDKSNIGVEEGNTFSYVVDKYSTLEGFNPGYYLGYEYNGRGKIYVTKGDKFTITIGSQRGIEQSFSEIDSIAYTVNYEDIIFDGLTYLNHEYGKIITTIDWEYQKQNQREGVWFIYALEEAFVVNPAFVLNEWELIDTPSEFGMKVDFSSIRADNVIVIDAEIKYQKITGMLSYESVNIKYAGDITIEIEYIIKLLGYQTQQLILPIFQWQLLLLIFSLVTLRKQRNKK